MGEYKSNEAGLKQQHSVADQISEMLERFKQRPTLGNLWLVERYIDMEFAILLRINVGDGHLIAYFQYLGIGGINSGLDYGETSCRQAQHLLRLSSDVQRASYGGATSRCDGENQAVLIDVVQAIENPDLVALPSFVRLDTEQRINSILPHALYWSTKSGFIFFGAIPNDESNIFIGSGNTTVNEQQLISQMIQCAPQVLNHISSDGGDDERDMLHARQIMAHLSGLNIILGNNVIRIAAKECNKFDLKIDDVFFGPFNFYLDKCQPLIRGQKIKGS